VSVDLTFTGGYADEINFILSIGYGYYKLLEYSVNLPKATLKLGTKLGTGGCNGGGKTSNRSEM
jgi:hypothetical protein